MGKISNYFKELKEELNEEKEEESSKEFKNQIKSEIKNEFSYEKDSLKYLGLSLLLILFLGLITFGASYLAFHHKLDFLFKGIVNKIETNNTLITSNTLDINTTNDCSKQLDGIYINNKEELNFSFDGEYSNSLNSQYVSFGTYTITNNTIIVNAVLEGDIPKTIKYNYTISADCSKITDTNTNKIYVKK